VENSTEIRGIIPSLIFLIIGFFLGIISGILSKSFDFYPGSRNYFASFLIITIFWLLVLIGILIVNKEEIEDVKNEKITLLFLQCCKWLRKRWYRLVFWLLLVLLLSPFGILALFFYSGDWVFSFGITVSLLWALGYSYIVEELFSEEKYRFTKKNNKKGIMVLKRLDKLNWDGKDLPKPCIHCGTMNNPDSELCALCGLPPFKEEKDMEK